MRIYIGMYESKAIHIWKFSNAIISVNKKQKKRPEPSQSNDIKADSTKHLRKNSLYIRYQDINP